MISDEQVARFRQEGYLIVDPFFDAEELAALRAEVARFRREGMLRNVATDGDGETPATGENLQLVPLSRRSELFRALPYAPKVVAAAAALLDGPVVRILDQLFLKPAETGLPTNWHTDNAYFKAPDPLSGTAMWIALDDANSANGSLKVVPRAFNTTPEHYRDLDSDHHIRMAEPASGVVECEVRAGGVVFFAFGTPHATGPNTTTSDRTGVGVHFMNAASVTGVEASYNQRELTDPVESADVQQPVEGNPYIGHWQDFVQRYASAGSKGFA